MTRSSAAVKCASCEAIFRNYREQVLLFHAISWRGHSLDTGLLVPCPLTKCTCLSNCILWSMDSLDPLHSIANCRVCCSIRALDNYLCNFICKYSFTHGPPAVVVFAIFACTLYILIVFLRPNRLICQISICRLAS